MGAPVLVDVGPCLIATESDAARRSARSLLEALEGSGFAIIVGHGIDQHLIAALDATSRQFFTSSPDN